MLTSLRDNHSVIFFLFFFFYVILLVLHALKSKYSNFANNFPHRLIDIMQGPVLCVTDVSQKLAK